MKRTLILFFCFSSLLFSGYAQSDYSSYLDKALQKLESGDCDGAQKMYNVYKDLTGNTSASVERLIADCQHDTTKTYKVGDRIVIDGNFYKVAYVEDGGKRGFAVCEMGSGPLKKEYLEQRKIPTWSEFNLIKENNKILKLDGRYWADRTSGSSYYVYRLAEGVSSGGDYYPMSYSRDILFIYRF